MSGSKVVLAVGHCPHGQRRQEADQYLEELENVLRPLAGSSLIVLAIDLNGRIVTGVPGVSGDLIVGEPDATGQGMTRCAQATHLWLPSTYSELHPGPSTTYTQANGAQHRIDYIALGGRASARRLRSWVEPDFDTANANEDHSPIVLDFDGDFRDVACRTSLWRPKYASERMLTKQGRQQIAEAMRAYRSPTWSVHPSDHCQHFQDYVHDVLRRHFAADPAGPRRPTSVRARGNCARAKSR